MDSATNKSFGKSLDKTSQGGTTTSQSHKHLRGVRITGATTQAQIDSVVAALVKLGATDAR